MVDSALAVGESIATTSVDLNKACDHIVRLLEDSSLLLESNSHASATFMAISALEEIAKIHIGIYRKSSEPIKRRKDPLYNHKDKHHIAASPTIAMGARLQAAIGEERMHELIQSARLGQLVDVRESALYVARRDGVLEIPSNVITKRYARELLLLAVEAFDDAFVGYTNHTFELEVITDRIFLKWENI